MTLFCRVGDDVIGTWYRLHMTHCETEKVRETLYTHEQVQSNTQNTILQYEYCK